MEYDKINNLLSSLELSEDNEMSEQLSKLLLDNMLKLVVYLIHIMKINQLDLKHLSKVELMQLF